MQADLSVFSTHGLRGAGVVTALTVQSARSVRGSHFVPSDQVVAQARAVFEDHAVVAAKLGMLGDPETPAAVARLWRELAGEVPLVIDPVLVSSSGASLLGAGGLEALREEFLPLATVITPNLSEAAALLGWGSSLEGGAFAAADAAKALLDFGPSCVVITGGHAQGLENAAEVIDVVAFESGEISLLRGPRLLTDHTHGTGCLFSAGVTSALALGAPLAGALDHARACVSRGLHSGREGAVWLDAPPAGLQTQD